MLQNKIKLLICDIDGTLTDSKVYYSKRGESLKCFSTKDGAGFQILKEKTKCKIALITNEKGGINKARAKKFLKLKTIDYFFDNAKDKNDIVYNICEKLNIHAGEIAYIGNDQNDKTVMKGVGFPACPEDAHRDIIEISAYVSTLCCGNGAARDIIDYMLYKNLLWKG